MERCELSDLLVDQCACRKHAPETKEEAVTHFELPTTGRKKVVIQSKWSGSHCIRCHDVILEGDDITPIEIRGATKWVHLECTDD